MNEEKLIEELRKYKSDGRTENIFADEENDNKWGEIRRNNLLIYLKIMHHFKPTEILIGEAPGYRGCRNTGIPFTDEFQMIEGVQGTHILGESQGYRAIQKNGSLEKERSASLVWNSMGEDLNHILMWNIFPFHPYKENLDSNRTPTVVECKNGLNYLKIILSEFETINKIIAIGRSAERAIITDLGLNKYNMTYVRHPSNGGQHKFVEGMKIFRY